MGSGSSKSKKTETSKSVTTDKVSKLPSKLPASHDKSLKAGTFGVNQLNNKPPKPQALTEIKNVKNLEKVSENNVNQIISSNNGNVSKSKTTERIESFENDSESEGEDISDVLAATRADNDFKARQSNNRPTEYYPESYAQRLQREQYAKAQQGMVRQKTIYRNPDEWELDDQKNDATEKEDTFDVSKFKEANINVMKNNTQSQNPVNTDIFSPHEVQQNGYQSKVDRYYSQTTNQKKENLPRYDTSEEALLAEIEQEFDL